MSLLTFDSEHEGGGYLVSVKAGGVAEVLGPVEVLQSIQNEFGRLSGLGVEEEAEEAHFVPLPGGPDLGGRGGAQSLVAFAPLDRVVGTPDHYAFQFHIPVYETGHLSRHLLAVKSERI